MSKKILNGGLLSTACISYTRTAVGEAPVEVFGWQVTGQTGVDETFLGQIRFENDILAQLESCN